jgi:hypothetical protein
MHWLVEVRANECLSVEWPLLLFEVVLWPVHVVFVNTMKPFLGGAARPINRVTGCLLT